MALNINGTTGISGVDGSVSAPALTGTDSNTGITFPSADTIKFATGGVERMAITNSGVSGITAGITQADEWRVNSSFTANDQYLGSNWERNDTDFSLIGSGMTESSGLFSFPATGIYSIKFSLGVYRNSATQVRYVGAFIYATTNDSNYYVRAQSYSSISSDDIANTAVHAHFLFDVTSTTDCKVKFRMLSEHDVTCRAETDKNDTHVTFIRLGDT